MTPPKPMRKRSTPEEGALSPDDFEAERALVGFLLVDPIEALDELKDLSNGDLFTPIFRRALTVARTRRANGLTVEPTSIRDDMARIAPLSVAEQDTLHEAVALNLKHQPSLALLTHIVRRLTKLAHQRDAQRAIYAAQQALVKADPESTGKIVTTLTEELAAISDGFRNHATGKTWRTPAEILAAAETNARTWLWPEVIPFASRTLLIGPPKTAGKSTLLWFLLALAAKGAAIDGTAIPATKFVVLTEEGDLELADKLRAFGVAGDAGLILSRPVAGDRPLRENVADAIEQAKRIGAAVLVIDTFVRFAGLGPDEENSSSAVAAAIATLEAATEAGMAVILLHHVNRRENASGGDASRGSTALPGAVEAILDLRPSGDAAAPDQRRLHIESRIVGVKNLRLALRKGDDLGVPDRFEVLGSDAEVAGSSAEMEIRRLLDFEPLAYTREEIQERVGSRKQDIERVLPRLARQSGVRRTGVGKRGDPFRYSGLTWTEAEVKPLTPAPLARITPPPVGPAEAASNA